LAILPFRIFKTPIVSLLPNAPHQNSYPDNTIAMMTKVSLPTYEVNYSLWHCPVDTKQGEHHRPQLKNNRTM